MGAGGEPPGDSRRHEFEKLKAHNLCGPGKSHATHRARRAACAVVLVFSAAKQASMMAPCSNAGAQTENR